MSYEERKRTYEGGAADMQINNVTKKLKPEDILGGSRDEPGKSVSRLLLNRAQFSRVIGKGGQTITHVRSATGVFMKGTDVDEEHRLVLLSGSMDQVLNAFDIITELLHQAILADNANLPPNRPINNDLSLNLLLEHSKAGKAVGSKGTMMQSIKNKSGATSIRIEKEPMDVNGVSLRKLTIEGPLIAVRRAHLLVLELYAESAMLNNNPNYSAYNNGPPPASIDPMSGSPMAAHAAHHARNMQPPAYSNAPVSGYEGGPPVGGVDPSSVAHMVQVPFPTLINYGVQAETVRQLTEMKAYLWRHFGLDLSISREVMAPSGMHGGGGNRPDANPYAGGNAYPPNPNQQQQQQQPSQNSNPSPHASSRGRSGGDNNSNNNNNSGNNNPNRPSIESIIDARKATNPSEVCFSIPRLAVGAIIGKGGQNLRDLQAQYGVRVYIEKEDFNGKRMVVLSCGSESGFDPQTMERTLLQCQDHIESIVEEQLNHQKESGGDMLIPE